VRGEKTRGIAGSRPRTQIGLAFYGIQEVPTLKSDKEERKKRTGKRLSKVHPISLNSGKRNEKKKTQHKRIEAREIG